MSATSFAMRGIIGEGLHVQSSAFTENAMDDYPSGP